MNKRRISAKNLGLFKLPYFCWFDMYLEFIFWDKKDVPFRFPPPRLMNKLDRFQKRIVEDYFTENGELPRWLKDFEEVERCVSVDKLTLQDEQNDLTFVGIPDLVVEFEDGSYGVIDFKTAYRKEGGDPLRPMYEVQLNAYAYLLEAEGKHVTQLALAYFEGDTGFIMEDLSTADLVEDWGHMFQFFVSLDPIELAPSKLIPPLLKKTKKLFDLEEPPAMKQGCRNCEKLADYLGLMTGKRPQLEAAIKDQVLSLTESCFLPTVMDLWDPSDK